MSGILRLHRQVALGDGGRLAAHVEREHCGGLNGVRGEAGLGELGAEGHGEAAGVGCGDQLLRIGADAIGEASLETVLRLFQCAALG